MSLTVSTVMTNFVKRITFVPWLYTFQSLSVTESFVYLDYYYKTISEITMKRTMCITLFVYVFVSAINAEFNM